MNNGPFNILSYLWSAISSDSSSQRVSHTTEPETENTWLRQDKQQGWQWHLKRQLSFYHLAQDSLSRKCPPFTRERSGLSCLVCARNSSEELGHLCHPIPHILPTPGSSQNQSLRDWYTTFWPNSITSEAEIPGGMCFTLSSRVFPLGLLAQWSSLLVAFPSLLPDQHCLTSQINSCTHIPALCSTSGRPQIKTVFDSLCLTI